MDKVELRLEHVGVHDNFIELGGDSILNIQIVARAHQVGLHFTPKQIFDHPTIGQLAPVVGTSAKAEAEQGLVTGVVPLTPMQHWFFAQHHSEPQHWNQAMMLEATEELDFSLLEQAAQQLLQHHDALRLRFVQEASGWRQFHAGAEATASLLRVDLSQLAEEEQEVTMQATAMALHASLDLAESNLMRLALFRLGPGRPNRLLMVIHHLAVDAVSWPILLEDLETAYTQLRRGDPMQLPSKTTAFKQWAEALVDYAQSDAVRDELDYWLTSCDADVSRLPIDKATGGDNTQAAARQVSVSLRGEETRVLLQDVPGVYNTRMDDVLLTTLVQTFSHWTGRESFTIDVESHGREEIVDDADVSRTVGWFTTISPVRFDLTGISEAGISEDNRGRTHPGEVLKSMKEQLRAVPNRGMGYGLLRYLHADSKVNEILKSRPQAEVLFNYLGQFDHVLPESSLFRLAGEFIGSREPRNNRSHLLEVNAFVIAGQLRIEWTYSENAHYRETIVQLAADFMDILRSLMAHCLSPEAGGYTPSDFPEADVDQEDLDDIMAEFGESIE